MSSSVRQLGIWVVLSGLVTVGVLLAGWDTAGRILTLLQLGTLVGLPLAFVLRDHLGAGLFIVAAGFALSFALSGLAAQSLIWFGLGGPALVVIVATVYGVALAWLLSSDPESAANGLRAETP